MRFAVVDANGVVVNVIEALSDYRMDDFTLVSADDYEDATIGAKWDGTRFTPPRKTPLVDVPSTEEQLSALTFVTRKIVADQVTSETLAFEEVPLVKALFPPWKEDLAVSVGEVYTFNDELVEVVQAHTTQSDWTPDVTPALWKFYREPDAVTAWIQPQGAHDAYELGARVTHNGKTWESLHNANVWEPPTQWSEI